MGPTCQARSPYRRQIQKVTSSTLNAGSRKQAANSVGTASRTPGQTRAGRLAVRGHRVFMGEPLEP